MIYTDRVITCILYIVYYISIHRLYSTPPIQGAPSGSILPASAAAPDVPPTPKTVRGSVAMHFKNEGKGDVQKGKDPTPKSTQKGASPGDGQDSSEKGKGHEAIFEAAKGKGFGPEAAESIVHLKGKGFEMQAAIAIENLKAKGYSHDVPLEAIELMVKGKGGKPATPAVKGKGIISKGLEPEEEPLQQNEPSGQSNKGKGGEESHKGKQEEESGKGKGSEEAAKGTHEEIKGKAGEEGAKGKPEGKGGKGKIEEVGNDFDEEEGLGDPEGKNSKSQCLKAKSEAFPGKGKPPPKASVEEGKGSGKEAEDEEEDERSLSRLHASRDEMWEQAFRKGMQKGIDQERARPSMSRRRVDDTPPRDRRRRKTDHRSSRDPRR